MSFNVSNNEFSGVPVFRPDFEAINPDWQQIVDGCHPLLRTVALAGVSAVQEGVRQSGELTERLLDIAFSDTPLLGDSRETTSAMFGPLHTMDNGLTRFTFELPEGPMLVDHGLHIADLARKLTRIANVETSNHRIPVARNEEQEAEQGSVSVVGWRRLHDMFADPYFHGGSLKGILAGHDIKTVDIHITDTHATDPESLRASTTVDVKSRYGHRSAHDEMYDQGTVTGLFAVLGIEISEDGLVSASTDNGVQQTSRKGSERVPYDITNFGDLGRYAEYFAQFPVR